MNTKVVDSMLNILAPTLDYHEGPMSTVPVVIDSNRKKLIDEKAKVCVNICKNDWDSYETSWDFVTHPFITYRSGAGFADIPMNKWQYRIADAYHTWESNATAQFSDYLAEFIRELRKAQYGDAIDHYFRLGKNLNQRDTIAVRRMADGYLKLLYPDGSFTKEEVEEVLRISLEMRRRVKEQLKKLGGMEFYDVNFSYIDNETFEEHYVSVPEQGGGKLIPEGMCNPGQIYTVSQGKSGMLGVFCLESQMLPGNGKFERTGIGSDRDAKESTNTAFNFLKANGNRISGSISTTTKDYIINYQDLQGIGMTGKLALPTLIAMCSIALGKPTLSSLAVLGEISISGTMMKVDELANSLQVCLDSGAKRVLLPITSAAELGTVPADLIGSFNLIFYSSAEDAVFKALGVE